ncbi:DUF4603 domain containing protein [Asbolus verrucosus]|uniref:DUF4603 domain containing protein n=1 Tax=Asbolus verrucosus TaxID=1661398 RepID=A0A482VSA6_ASBVE|nr:DUF4603 domain containing protein [Asbolus verrucosus]
MKYPQLVSMPSAVSDWLEEQLEARGIDAVVYTRYILSLLHSDTVDVIYSDEDLHFSHLKKVVSPQELAKRYYAAFPPLTRNHSASPTKLISLIPKWIPSPKKKPVSINSRKQNGRSYEDTMRASRTPGKQRFGAYFTGHSNNKKEVGCGRQSEGNNGWNSSKKSRTENVPKSDEADLQMANNQDWNMCEDANMYDDLPVDIKELLEDSPTSHDVTVEMMNLANMRDTGRRGFIPCGTNITSSIWTNEAAMEENTALFDNSYNSAAFISDLMLDLQFSSINFNKNEWAPTGDFKFTRDNKKKTNWNLPNGRWSDDSGCFEDDHANNQLTLSLIKLNHNKEVSAFAEVIPKNHTQHFSPFSKVIGSGIHRDTSLKTVDIDKEKDDLLTSVRSHFRPINEKVENYLQGQYADGATFVVSNTWDKINYRRTESGAMYMENDYSMRRKYCEYKMKNGPTNVEFVLKYLVCQNDKSCQTEDADAEVEAINLDRQLREQRPDDNSAASNTCACQTLATTTDHSLDNCFLHPARPDSAVLTEVMWQQQQTTPCDKCNNDSTLWNTNSGGLKNVRRDLEWQFGTMSKIWSGGVVCHSCLGRPPSTLQHSKLREDVSQDGDQLLSDLSTIQKSYMEEGLPATEFTCDIAEFLLPKERKRRHSLMTNTQLEDSWSFASRLEEDCLIQMSTIPTLRSVTL